MRTIVLLEKATPQSLSDVKKKISNIIAGLRINFHDIHLTETGWLRLRISGKDEKAAESLFKNISGLAPITTNKINRFTVINGKIITLNKSKQKILIDVGILSSRFKPAHITLQRLQAHLTNGKKLALNKIRNLFGLIDNFPLNIRILSIDDEIEAELTGEQQKLYENWINSFVDRFTILGESEQNIELAIKKARINRDVLYTEPLGILDHMIICKLGTDAKGLLCKLGKHLPNSRISIFSPRKILKIFT